VHLFNPAASKITEWPAEEAIGLDFHTVIAIVNEKGEALPPENTHSPKPWPQTPLCATTMWLSTKTGKRIAISLIVSPVVDPATQQATSVVGVFSDITQEKARRSPALRLYKHRQPRNAHARSSY
jgi:PAS domain S-box-containing protein